MLVKGPHGTDHLCKINAQKLRSLSNVYIPILTYFCNDVNFKFEDMQRQRLCNLEDIQITVSSVDVWLTNQVQHDDGV